MFSDKHIVRENSNIKLAEMPTLDTGEIGSKAEAKSLLKKNTKKLKKMQDMFYAFDQFSLLLVFQAMDAAGKDGTIKHVASGINPQGMQVVSFKQPSSEELDHGYLWRISKALPERGRIGIFNRSHYEDVLVVRVHDLLKYQKIPKQKLEEDIWKKRYDQINSFEEYLYENGTVILKFFLHVSKEEQKERFLARIDDPSKNWKFSSSDIEERKYWKDYQKCYQEAINATSKKHAPWFVIPADKKWYMRYAVSNIIVEAMESLDMHYPKLGEKEKEKLEECRQQLISE